jgi:hypothetical protein
MKMFVVLSHTLTEKQIQEIKHRFHITDIVYPPEHLRKLWANIPPEGEWEEQWIQDLKDWLSQQLSEGDKLIVQGEFGAVFSLVSWLKNKGFQVYYATSLRKAEEMKQGETVVTRRTFEHVCLREYPID